MKVTSPDGQQVYTLSPVDSEARQEIESAKNLQFDEDFFTADETDDEVSIGLAGVPFGVDDDTPLEIVQDTDAGLVLGSKAPFSTAIAPDYDPESTYAVSDKVMYRGKFYRCTTAISVAEAWNSSHWTEDTVTGMFPTGTNSTDNQLVNVSGLTTAVSGVLPSGRTDGDVLSGMSNSLAWDSGEPVNFTMYTQVPGEVIAGKEYRIARIGNQVWMAENLDFAWEGLTVGGAWDSSIAKAWYPNNDEETYGFSGEHYGLLYNLKAKEYLQDNRATLIPGWHVPNEEDFRALFTYMGITGHDDGGYGTIYDNAGTQLKASYDWNGTDIYDFDWKPAGHYTPSGTDGLGQVGELWSSTVVTGYRWKYYVRSEYNYVYMSRNSGYSSEPAVSIRLIKDSV